MMAFDRFRQSVAGPAVAERRERLRRGRVSEAIAAGVLMAKGYRIVGRRVKTPAGEIDIIAVRAKRLAFVEVKRRRTREDAEASITKKQASRVRRAANLWLARHPSFHEHEFGFDVVFLVPRQWPRHIANGL
jgi:putative endonuclease